MKEKQGGRVAKKKKVKIEKIPPLTCKKCKSTSIVKWGKKILCDGCKTVFEGDKETPMNKTSNSRGRSPWHDTGDYYE